MPKSRKYMFDRLIDSITQAYYDNPQDAIEHVLEIERKALNKLTIRELTAEYNEYFADFG